MKKIKGSRKTPAPSVLITTAALSLCVLLPLRVFHVAKLIEPETGFYAENNWSIWVFYLLCAAVILYLMASSFMSSRINRVRNCMTKNRVLGIVSLLTGAAVMYDAVYEMLRFLDLFGAYDPYTGDATLSYLTKNGGTALLFGAVFAALSAVFFLVYALSCFKRSIRMSAFRVLSVAPVVWSICRIIFRFVTKISFVNVSDLLLELFMLVFVVSFTLAFAQVVTNVTPEICAWRLFGCGLPGALLAFLVSVPRLIMLVLFHSDRIVAAHPLAPCDLMLSVFIPVFLYFTTVAVKKKKLDLPQAEEPQAAEEPAGEEAEPEGEEPQEPEE